MAMVDIAHAELDVPVSLSVISQRQDLPLPYLEQLFNKLRKAGLVKSSRGSTGGYSLSKPAAEISIVEIVTSVDTPLKATRCNSESQSGCQNVGEQCLTHDLWDELSAVVHVFLGQITLEDICKRRVRGLGRFNIIPRRDNTIPVERCA